MIRPIVRFLLVVALSSPGVMSVAQNIALPPSMFYRGKLIHPTCLSFFGDRSRFKPVNLAACGYATATSSQSGIVRSVSRQNESWQEYQPPTGKGYDRYRYLGTRDGLVYIQSEGNWGGSGNFSAVNAFERQGDAVSLKKEIAGGDHCNGGIVSASLVKGDVDVTTNVTPRALLALDIVASKYPNPNIIDYGNLEDSAVSCLGEARFRNGTLTSIRIDPDAVLPARQSDKTYMGCISRELIKAKKAQALALNPEALAMLIIHMKVCAGERM